MDNNFVAKSYGEKLKGRMYGLLCEREKNGEWQKFLDTISIQLIGVNQELKTINYYALMAKINALHYLSYEYFRKTVFECINIINGLFV